jgi:hypothetical protein
MGIPGISGVYSDDEDDMLDEDERKEQVCGWQ